MYTAIILAGGSSRRMGRDKPALIYNGKTFLQAAVDRFSVEFDEVYVSVADENKYSDVTAQKVVDIYPHCGPMAGLHAGLLKSGGEGVFLVAADLPFSSPQAAKKLISLCGDSDICAMTDKQGRYEPLFAYYKKNIIGTIEELIKSGCFKMTVLLEKSNIKIVDKADLGDAWREDILLNVNYPQDYDKLLSERKKSRNHQNGEK